MELEKYGLKIRFRNRGRLLKHRAGGVATIYKNDIESQLVFLDSNTPDTQWFLYKASNGEEILMGNIYVPPKGSKYLKDNIFDLIECDLIQYSVKYDVSETLIAGDFNAKTRNEPDFVTLDDTLIDQLGIGYDVESEMNMVENRQDTGVQQIRKNRDGSALNEAGRKLIKMCKNHNVLILN